MPRLSKAIEAMFSGEMGSTIYERTVDTIEKESMLPMMEKGILVGFSGGGDSVMLIAFLHEYQRRTKKPLNLLAVHVNHCIRGEESDRDEEFARAFLKELCIPFESVRIDVVALSEKLGTGIEETARNARYSAFDDIIKSRNDISTIAVAHNSADNAETVIMNMLRGSGLSGVCGIFLQTFYIFIFFEADHAE
jgi:tRNA(Ile)-lysidine synthase